MFDIDWLNHDSMTVPHGNLIYGTYTSPNLFMRTTTGTDLPNVCSGFRGGSIPQPDAPKEITYDKFVVKLEEKELLLPDGLTPKRILKSGPATIVFWCDGTKTIVKRSPDEPDNTYAAFTAALGIKAFGSNSALKRIIERMTEEQKK